MRTSLEVPGEVLLHSICPWNESSVLCAPLLAVKPPSFHLWGNLETRRCSGLLWQRTGPDLVNNTRRGSAEWLTSWFAHSHSTLVLQVCIPGDPSFQVNQDSWLPYLSTEQSQRQTESSSLIRFANESKQLKYNSIKKISTRHRSPMTLWLSALVKPWECPWRVSPCRTLSVIFPASPQSGQERKWKKSKATCFLWFKGHSSGLAAVWEDSKCIPRGRFFQY